MSLEKPTPSGSEYLEMEKGIQSKRKELQVAPVDQMGEIVEDITGREKNRQNAYDAMYEDAHTENSRIDAQHAERIAQIDAAIQTERAKIGSENTSVEELSAVVQRIKELEAEKNIDRPKNTEAAPATEIARAGEPLAEPAIGEQTPPGPSLDQRNQTEGDPVLEKKKIELFRRYEQIPKGGMGLIEQKISDAEFDKKTNTDLYRGWVAHRDGVKSQIAEIDQEYKDLTGLNQMHFTIEYRDWKNKGGT